VSQTLIVFDSAASGEPDVTQQIVVTLSFPTFSRLVERSIKERQSLSDLISQILDNTR
jgi:hypothetical protein